VLAADHDVGCSDEGGGFVCAGAPDFAVLGDVRENVAALFAGAGIVDCDGLAAGKLALCGGGRAGAF